MRYLMLQSDGECLQTDDEFEPSEENTVKAIDSGEIQLIRFEKGCFEVASVHAVDDSRSLTWVPIEEYVA